MSPRLVLAALLAVLPTTACRALRRAPKILAADRGFQLVIEGNRAVGSGELRDVLAFDLSEFERSGFRPAFADDAAYQAEVYYRGRGFPDASVTYELDSEAKPPVLTLLVEERQRTFVDEEGLTYQGVSLFTREQVLAFFEGPRTGVLSRGRLLYVEERVRSVPERMGREYQARGHLEARVTPVEVELSEDRTEARLNVTVLEGPLFQVGSITWGASRPPQEALGRCKEIFTEFQGQEGEPGQRRVYNARVPFELRGALRAHLSSLGYPDAEVSVEGARHLGAQDEGCPEGAHVDLRVAVEAGQKVTIGAIRFQGQESTRLSFLRSRVRLEPGETWSGERALQSTRRLYRSGLFRRIDLELEGEEAVRDVVISLEEAPSREYFIEPGWGSYEQLRLRAGVREKNLFGTGRQLRAEATYATRAQRGLLSFTDPWLFQRELIGDLTFTWEEREDASFTGGERGVGAFITRPWGSMDDTSTFGYVFRRSEISDVDVVEEDVGEEALRDVNLSALRLTQRHNRRKHDSDLGLFFPDGGHFAEVALEWGMEGLGSDIDYLRTTLSAMAYRKVRPTVVLASAFRTGVIDALEGDVIPLQERFYNGGENSVRSYEEFELGPKDSRGNPIGGEAFSTLSVELRRQVGDTKFAVALFGDAGSVQEKASQWGSLEDVGTALGAGVRYVTPVGPLRLDLAFNPDPEEGEDEYVLHFSLGLAF